MRRTCLFEIARLFFCFILLGGCGGSPTVRHDKQIATISDVQQAIHMELISIAPELCYADPECAELAEYDFQRYSAKVIEGLWDYRKKKIIKDPDCGDTRIAGQNIAGLTLDEWGAMLPDDLEIRPSYKIDSIVVDLKTVATSADTDSGGFGLADSAEVVSVRAKTTRTAKKVQTTQRKLSLKPEKSIEILDRYMKGIGFIIENDKDESKYPKLAERYRTYLLEPRSLATELFCALNTYMADDLSIEQSELELVFVFQVVTTKKEEESFELNVAIVKVESSDTLETSLDNTHTLTVKLKAVEAADDANTEALINALHGKWIRSNGRSIEYIRLFEGALKSNAKSLTVQTGVDGFLWDAFTTSVLEIGRRDEEYKKSNGHGIPFYEALPDCKDKLETWPFCRDAEL